MKKLLISSKIAFVFSVFLTTVFTFFVNLDNPDVTLLFSCHNDNTATSQLDLLSVEATSDNCGGIENLASPIRVLITLAPGVVLILLLMLLITRFIKTPRLKIVINLIFSSIILLLPVPLILWPALVIGNMTNIGGNFYSTTVLERHSFYEISYANTGFPSMILEIFVAVLVVVSIATISLHKHFSGKQMNTRFNKNLVFVSIILSVTIFVFSFIYQIVVFSVQYSANVKVGENNKQIAQAIQTNDLPRFLVGDYWQIATIDANLSDTDTGSVSDKEGSDDRLSTPDQSDQFSQSDVAENNTLIIETMASCMTPKYGAPDPGGWIDLMYNKEFTYVLRVNYDVNEKIGKQTRNGFPECTLDDIEVNFGIPEEIIDVGDFKLLHFSSNKHLYSDSPVSSDEKNEPVDDTSVQSDSEFDSFTQEAESFYDPECEKNLLTVVAHQDDDLLFMVPDLQYMIDDGYCVQTIYLTAGDNGKDKNYWESREIGGAVAHSVLSEVEFQDPVEDKVTSIKSVDNRFALHFLKLPDGGWPDGDGIEKHNWESIKKLFNGDIDKIQSIDIDDSDDVELTRSWTKDQIIDYIGAYIKVFNPTYIFTQTPRNESRANPDHPDHLNAGRFAQAAFIKYASMWVNVLWHYAGYSISSKPINVFDEDRDRKAELFFEYSDYDDDTKCRNRQECSHSGLIYPNYIQRQYRWYS
jgi:LmbE family N-acetylglucosaminyl deacetylase